MIANGNSFSATISPVLPPEADPAIQSLPYLFRVGVPCGVVR